MAKAYKLLLGIEHLMTGVTVRNEKGDSLTFERESPSIVRVLSDSPIEAYWPAKQAWMAAEEIEALAAEKYSEGEIEWIAQKIAPEMVAIDSAANQQYRNHNVRFVGEDMLKDLPTAVIKAMRRKHGAEANQWIRQLRPAGGYWSYEWCGMYLGVEPDGYIHS